MSAYTSCPCWLGEAQRLETDMQIETTPAIAKLQRETYDESREIYHKLMQ